MLRLIVALLVVWLILTIVGFIVEGLLWLATIALVLFAVTAVWGWLKRKPRAAGR